MATNAPIGVASVQPASLTPERPTDRVIRGADGVLMLVDSKLAMIDQSVKAAQLLYDRPLGLGAGRGQAAAMVAVFLTSVAAFRGVVTAAKGTVPMPDAPALDHLAKWTGAVFNCGLAVGSIITTLWSSGALGFITVTQGLACAKSGLELWDAYRHERIQDQFFESTAGKTISLSVDALAVVGSLMSIGVTTAVKAGEEATAISMRRGLAMAASRAALRGQKVAATMTGLEGTSTLLSGVKLIVMLTKDGHSNVEIPADPDTIRRALLDAGILPTPTFQAEPPDFWNAYGPRGLFEWTAPSTPGLSRRMR